MTLPKVLTLDIETSANVAHVWSLFNVNVSLNQLLESTRVISWAAKWHGTPRVLFASEFHDGREAMIEGIYKLWSAADIIVHFNGGTFDMPHLRREFLVAGLTPPPPVQEVDLLKVAKSRFRFTSNKLAYITEYLGLETKLSHSGHSLWVKCMAGDPKAWATMRRYNKQDVVVTEKLYDRLRPWIKTPPNMNLFADSNDNCPYCGSADLERRGYRHTQVSVFQRYACRACAGWSSSGKSIARTDVRGTA